MDSIESQRLHQVTFSGHVCIYVYNIPWYIQNDPHSSLAREVVPRVSLLFIYRYRYYYY